jgi:ATP-dependent DNA ligase
METFRKMPRLKGSNSNNERESLLLKLLFDCTDNEPKYIVRFVQKNLKIGAAEATMQSALVRAFLIKNYYDETNGKPKPKSWANVIPNYTAKV